MGSVGVPTGVAAGIVLGIIKIIFNIELLTFLVPLYILALMLPACSTEEYVSIGWDSAGVTTGPVTVPLVLSIGSSLGLASGTEGFGVLACCSICPILSVLLCGRRPFLFGMCKRGVAAHSTNDLDATADAEAGT